MKARESAKAESRVLAADQCPVCASKMRRSRGPMSLPINGEAVTIRGIKHLQCTKCGEGLLNRIEARELQERAFQRYRQKHNLLSPDAIRDIRLKLGMSQRAMARELQLGEVTISRWESNRTVQSAALDLLLRLMRDVPEVRRFLKERAA